MVKFTSTVMLVLLAFGGNALAQNCSVNLEAIRFIESSGRANAIGDGGKALGLFQLHAGAVCDASRFLGKKYSHKEALEPSTALILADAYLNKVIPRYLKHYGLKDTLENRLTAYNMGIGAVIKGKIATSYIKKYKQFGDRAGVSPPAITANRLKTA